MVAIARTDEAGSDDIAQFLGRLIDGTIHEQRRNRVIDVISVVHSNSCIDTSDRVFYPDGQVFGASECRSLPVRSTQRNEDVAFARFHYWPRTYWAPGRERNDYAWRPIVEIECKIQQHEQRLRPPEREAFLSPDSPAM